MIERYYALIAGIIFLLIAVAHLVRVVLGATVGGGFGLPVPASDGKTAVLAGLAARSTIGPKRRVQLCADA